MNAATSGPETTVRCLLVRTGELLCAIPVDQVRRVVRALRVTAVPDAAPELAGVAEYAGEPVVVLDLAALVDAPPAGNPEFPVTVITRSGESGELIGLAADAAIRFAEVAADAATPAGAGPVVAEVLVDGEPARLVDLGRLGGSS